ncbi:MAG: DUF177 domain-containing protein [Chitinispirillaceae bacterium]|nr:DUF177 domain-containing protein [Chitinispirillaceae bacterium]
MKWMKSAADEDDAVFYYSCRNPQVDLGSAIYDEIMISLPMKPLCKETCEGIQIGAAGVSVTGSSEAIDPRWEALKKLKDGK